jgi:hypothetical protein
MGRILWKPLLARERHQHLCLRLGGWSFPAELMQASSKAQGHSQAEGVRQLPGETQRFVAPLQGLVWIPKEPQGPGSIHLARHARILSIYEGMGVVGLRVIEGNTPLRVRAGRAAFSLAI